MNPLRWFRWKIIAVLAIVVGGFYLLGLDPLAERRINDLGSEGQRTRFNISALNLGVLRGLLDFDQLRVASARSSKSPAPAAEEKVFSAEKIQFQIDPAQALRKRLHGDVIVRMPRLQIERAPDGSIRIGEIGDEEGAAKSERPPTDWVKAAVEWAKRLKDWEEKTRQYRQRGEPKPGEAPEKAPEAEAKRDYSRRVTYPFDDVARYVARVLAGEELEIHFVDSSDSAGTPKELAALTHGTLKIENLSDNPASYSEPVRWTLSGDFAGAKLELSGDLDFTKAAAAAGKSALNLKLKAVGLPLELVNRFAGDSLPLRFTGGKVDVDTTVGVRGFDGLAIAPRLSLIEAKSEPQPGVSRIAGADAATFCRTFNEVGTFELNDLRLEGSFSDPKVHLGTTLQELVTSGAKAFIAKHGRKALDQATDKAKQELDKILEKGLKKDDGTGDAIKQGVDGLKSIFGGEKKPEPKPEEPKSE